MESEKFKKLFEEYVERHKAKYMDTPDKSHIEAFYKFLEEKNLIIGQKVEEECQ